MEMPVLCMLPTQDKEDNHSFFTHRAFVVLTVVNISKAVYVLKDNADGVDGLQQSLVVSILPKKSKPSKDQRSQSASLSRKEFVKYSERLERSCTGALHDVFAAEPAPSFSFAPPSPNPPPSLGDTHSVLIRVTPVPLSSLSPLRAIRVLSARFRATTSDAWVQREERGMEESLADLLP